MRKLKMDELNRISVDNFKIMKKNPVVIILDNIRSLHNVGSAFRTSDAFLVEKIYLTGITGTPPNREINKTALGATDSVEWEYIKDSFDLVNVLKGKGYKIACIEQVSDGILLQDFTPVENEKYCFVFGNEVFGVDDKVVEIADIGIEIPQFGTKHSLNVSVSIGIVLWDFLNKLKANL